ncbi:hypothetical protein [Vreelandella stevensii]|uniref:hypothetical protein n=1 Tax=Vreelandella stevensii TaxID=502821 RepID=UPI00030894C7|nr:hypothetical protein [Halomonas stevensii]
MRHKIPVIISSVGCFALAATRYEVDGVAFSVFGSDRYHERADQQSWATFQQWLAEML